MSKICQNTFITLKKHAHLCWKYILLIFNFCSGTTSFQSVPHILIPYKRLPYLESLFFITIEIKVSWFFFNNFFLSFCSVCCCCGELLRNKVLVEQGFSDKQHISLQSVLPELWVPWHTSSYGDLAPDICWSLL
jgi:hypothetical protein